ncbi:hypothetical protein [Streptomyces flaveolus]
MPSPGKDRGRGPDTPREVTHYYRHGRILPHALRRITAKTTRDGA